MLRRTRERRFLFICASTFVQIRTSTYNIEIAICAKTVCIYYYLL